MRCCAVLASSHNHKIERIQLCQQTATFRIDGYPLCGTHINRVPDWVCVEPIIGFGTTEKL